MYLLVEKGPEEQQRNEHDENVECQFGVIDQFGGVLVLRVVQPVLLFVLLVAEPHFNGVLLINLN